MIHAHPPMEHLTAYATGQLPAGMSLLVAAHLTYCPACRQAVSTAEALGGALMESEDISGVAAPDLDAVLACLGEPEVEASAPRTQPTVRVADTITGSPLPRPILLAAGKDVDDLDWRFRMPGLHECRLDGFDGEEVSLLRARPGVSMLDHTHSGEEATLILSGAMQDGDITYKRGDVAVADHNDDHSPRIVGDEVCYCLYVMSGHIKFTGRLSRALNLFTG